MTKRKLVRIIADIRDSHPDIERLYLEGQCYNFCRILRTICNNQGEFYYSTAQGHAYFKYKNHYFDIRGKHSKPAKDLRKLDLKEIKDKPHRWGGRDQRRLSKV